MRPTRRCSDCAARREKLSSRMRCGSAPSSTSRATRAASVSVLPEPAPAMISSGGGPPAAASRPWNTAWRCSSLRLVEGTRAHRLGAGGQRRRGKHRSKSILDGHTETRAAAGLKRGATDPSARVDQDRRQPRSAMALMFILLLLHAYVGWRLIPALDFAPPLQWLLGALLLASWLLMPMALLARRIRRQPLSDRLAWTGLLLMGLFSSLFVLTLLRDVLALPLWAASFWWPLPGWLVPASAAAVPALAALLTLWGLVNARRTAQVVRVDVPIDGAAGGAARLFDRADQRRACRPDHQARLPAGASSSASTRSRPTWWRSPATWSTARCRTWPTHVAPLAGAALAPRHLLRHRQPRVLQRRARLGRRAAPPRPARADERARGAATMARRSLVLAGVTDYSAHHFDAAHRSDPQAAHRRRARRRAVRVLLAHQPRSAAAAADGRLRPAAVRPHARRAVLAVELVRAAAAAVHRRPAPAGRTCGSTPAAAPATGARRSASARRRRSPTCAWWRPERSAAPRTTQCTSPRSRSSSS